MKKIFFFLVMALGFSVATEAQQIIAAKPAIFKPAQIGGYSKGIAYLSSPPILTGFTPIITASIYMLAADGKTIVEVPVSGEIIHMPSDWDGAFYGPNARYPMAIPVTVQIHRPAQKGEAPIEDITFF